MDKSLAPRRLASPLTPPSCLLTLSVTQTIFPRDIRPTTLEILGYAALESCPYFSARRTPFCELHALILLPSFGTQAHTELHSADGPVVGIAHVLA
jgi:hypothetical protein